jgi:hypothetical protein
MSRLNLTLDPATWAVLGRHAEARHTGRATLARELLQEALARRDELERRRKLAADYAADRDDAVLLLAEIEGGQFDPWGDES